MPWPTWTRHPETDDLHVVTATPGRLGWLGSYTRACLGPYPSHCHGHDFQSPRWIARTVTRASQSKQSASRWQKPRPLRQRDLRRYSGSLAGRAAATVLRYLTEAHRRCRPGGRPSHGNDACLQKILDQSELNRHFVLTQAIRFSLTFWIWNLEILCHDGSSPGPESRCGRRWPCRVSRSCRVSRVRVTVTVRTVPGRPGPCPYSARSSGWLRNWVGIRGTGQPAGFQLLGSLKFKSGGRRVRLGNHLGRSRTTVNVTRTAPGGRPVCRYQRVSEAARPGGGSPRPGGAHCRARDRPARPA